MGGAGLLVFFLITFVLFTVEGAPKNKLGKLNKSKLPQKPKNAFNEIVNIFPIYVLINPFITKEKCFFEKN